jgi:hypothetical protein
MIAGTRSTLVISKEAPMLQSVLNVPGVLGESARTEEKVPAWVPSSSIAFTDLERIFSDIIDTAIISAASVACSIGEYREGLELMVSRLEMTISSTAAFDSEL